MFDGIRFEHMFRFARADDHSFSLLHQFVLCILKGKLPPEVRPYVYGARLVATAKPNDPGTQRPLGGGMVFR